jgi:hypothetical protein
MVAKKAQSNQINPLFIVITLTAFWLQPTQKSNAQQAVTGSFGCGTGCSVKEAQLSSPSKMGNGWSKVLVELTERCAANTGRGCREGYKHRTWYFAKCDGDSWGQGTASDGSNAYTERIYDQEGNPITYNSAGAIYSKWKALCDAQH